jgi:hypothetical protein
MGGKASDKGPGSGRRPGPGRGPPGKIGNGPGWGGLAKGTGTGKPSRPHGKEGLKVKAAIPPEIRAEKAKHKAVTRETMLGVYERIAIDETAPHMAQIVAADKWLDRTEGKPVQTNINENKGTLRVQVILKG